MNKTSLPSLSAEDKPLIRQAVGPNLDILAATVAKLYMAYPDKAKWTDTRATGPIILLRDHNKNSAFFFRMVDWKTLKVVWELELYRDFQYRQERPFFHTFDTDNYTAGLSFVNENEALEFFSRISQRDVVSQAKQQKRIDTSTKKRRKGFVARLRGNNLSEDVAEELTSSDISAPSDFRHLYHIGYDPKKGFDISQIPPEWKSVMDQAGVTPEQLKDKRTARFIFDFLQKASGTKESRISAANVGTTVAPVPVEHKEPVSSRALSSAPLTTVPRRPAPPPLAPPRAPPSLSTPLPPPPPPPSRPIPSTSTTVPTPPVPPVAPTRPSIPDSLGTSPPPPPSGSPIPPPPPRQQFLTSIQQSNMSQLRKISDSTPDLHASSPSIHGGEGESSASTPGTSGSANPLASALARALESRSRAWQGSESESEETPSGLDEDGDDDW